MTRINGALIAPCGMNCQLCIAYQAMQENINKKGFKRKYCPGCIPRGENCLHMGDQCQRLAEGRLRFCYECPTFPCKRLKSLNKRYQTKYHMSMIENLEHIKENGLEAFLQEQEKKWRCPECGGTICCHNGLCLHCQLDTLKQNKKLCWNETEDVNK